MKLNINIEHLKSILRSLIMTRGDEIGCEECFKQLDEFVELHLRGKDAAEALPLVQHHPEMCKDCREEFSALLNALQAA